MKDTLDALLASHGQQHLLGFWDQLDDAGRQSLAGQIRQLDYALIDRLWRGKDDRGDMRALLDRAAPPPAVRLDRAANRFTPAAARARAHRALAAGEVGVILVAGGQGTRLGLDHPKGMYPIGPVSGHSLFQIHVEKVLAAGRRHRVRLPIYLMTSPATHEQTVEYFAQHGRFGLPEDDLHIFCQGTMPAVDAATGKILLEAPGRIALSPDGHGGTLAALVRSGALDDIERRGARHLFYFQVDNPMVDVCAAEFIGYHLLAQSEMSTQVVAKRDPLDRLGNVVQVDGRLMVIEYSDLPDEVARRRNPDGGLTIWAGSIAVHMLATAFLRRMAGSAAALPFHLARKKVAYVDPSGQHVEPQQPNAIKFERFIFDLISSAANAIVVEVDPAAGFAPLKNAPGAAQDTPETVRAAMMSQHRAWLRRAGAEISDDVAVEISPLFALDADDLGTKLVPGTCVTAATFFA